MSIADFTKINHVMNGLYISGATPLNNPKNISDRSIKYILCCTSKSELGAYHENILLSNPNVVVVYLPYKDNLYQNLWAEGRTDIIKYSDETNKFSSDNILGIPLIEIGIGFIDHALSNNQNILVHCRAGMSRSASVIILYLMRKYRISYEEAEAFLSSKRPVIRPNSYFREQLNRKN